MKTKFIFAGVISLAALVAGSLGATDSAPAPEAAATKAAGQHVKPLIDKGMTAGAVRQAIGAPLGIKPIKSEQGSAEIWTYRRVASATTRQVAVSTKMITATFGTMDVPTPEYRTENIKTYQVTALLMVDGKLELARQWKETERSFDP